MSKHQRYANRKPIKYTHINALSAAGMVYVQPGFTARLPGFGIRRIQHLNNVGVVRDRGLFGGVRMTQKCPFCGGEDLEIGRGTKDREGWPTYCYCLCCGAQGPWVYINDVADLTSTNLIAEKTGWNKQYLLAEVERLRVQPKDCS